MSSREVIEYEEFNNIEFSFKSYSDMDMIGIYSENVVFKACEFQGTYMNDCMFSKCNFESSTFFMLVYLIVILIIAI